VSAERAAQIAASGFRRHGAVATIAPIGRLNREEIAALSTLSGEQPSNFE
jgi:hypothetical protein